MNRAVIVGGVRTPFVRAADAFDDVDAPELGRLVTRELIERFDLDANEIDELICGNVASPIDAANVARVIALRAGIPRDKVAHSVHRNCASGMESLTQAVDRVNAGHAETVVAVGVDSMSNVPLFYPKSFGEKLLRLSKAKSAWQKLTGMASFRLKDFAPKIGIKLGLTDPVTGMLMGDTADKLARTYNVPRDEQDAFALASHEKALAAWNEGRLDDETFTVYPRKSDPVQKDVGPRDGQSMEKLGKLKPYFDKKWGTITVGNSCGITDGGVAILVMSEEKAGQLGYEPLGRLKSYAYSGCDPSTMGLGPVYSSAKALKLAGQTTEDMELVEINEAFAAQVLACTRAFETPPSDCTDADGRATLGPVDPEKLNVNGGAIAIGHPVGATGGRLVLTLLQELKRRNQTTGLATLCIGGGQGGACVVERLAA